MKDEAFLCFPFVYRNSATDRSEAVPVADGYVGFKKQPMLIASVTVTFS